MSCAIVRLAATLCCYEQKASKWTDESQRTFEWEKALGGRLNVILSFADRSERQGELFMTRMPAMIIALPLAIHFVLPAKPSTKPVSFCAIQLGNIRRHDNSQ